MIVAAIELALAPVGGYWLVALLGAALAASVFWGPTLSRATTWRRRTLRGLRLTAIVLVLMALLRPTVVYTRIKPQQSTLVLLADRSRSMQVADGPGGKSRWQWQGELLTAAAPTLSELAEKLTVKLYWFAEDLAAGELSDGRIRLPEAPDGQATALGSALDQVLEREAGQRLAGVILLSDGAQRALPPRDAPPQTATRRLADLGQTLYTIGFGQGRAAGQSRDVALENLEVLGQSVFVKNQLTARATVRVAGLVNQPLTVELLFEQSPGQMQVVDTRQVVATGENQSLPVELSYVPQVPGEFKLALRVAPQTGEAVVTNNELATFVTVRKGGLNVLYVEGDLQRIEKRFFRAALDRSPNVKVDYLYLDAQVPETRPPDLVERFLPGKFDVIVFGDVDRTAFTDEELAELLRAVQGGAGWMMLGGFHSFGPGGYQKSPVAELLPIEMDPLERQPFGETVSSDLHLEGPLAMRPTALGQRHFVLLLGPAPDNPRIWSELPPLDGANRFRGLKPRANVLAESDRGAPLLVAQDVGLGRVLAFAGDSTWRWVLGGHEAAHQRFWRQVILWLARKDQAGEGEVWVEIDPRRYAVGRRVEFTAGARTATGEAVSDARLEGEIVRPDGSSSPVRFEHQADFARGSWAETAQPGDYTLRVTARQGEETLGQASARFLVFAQDLELENPAADLALLASLASQTGGESLPPEQFPALLERLRRQPPPVEVESEARQNLWDTWPLFGLLVAVLSLEWTLRKRWGMV